MVRCRKCGGKHFTFKCKQHDSLPEVKTNDEDICATAPVTKKKSVLFSSSPDEILGLGLEDIQLSDEETLKLDAEELNMQRQPSLQQPLTPSTSDKGEILASEYLSNVGIFSKNVAPRAVMNGHVRIVKEDGMSQLLDIETKVGVGSELLIERSPWLKKAVYDRLEGETLCIIIKAVPEFPIEGHLEACQYYDVNQVFDSLQMDDLDFQSTSEIVSKMKRPCASPKKSRFTVLLEKDFVRGTRKGKKQALGGTTEGGVHAVGTRSRRVVAKKQEEDPTSTQSKRHGSGFLMGEEVVRERAAYLLDKRHRGFSNVPPTALTKVAHGGKSEILSIQKYRDANDSVEDYGPGYFRKVPAIEIQKVGILDIRLFNTDRHGGNILWKCPNQQGKMPDETCIFIPIDHGGCLPDYCHLNDASFDWAHWGQASEPWDERSLQHINNLNPIEDAEILRRKLHVRESCVLSMIICTIVLKECVLKHDFLLREVADLFLDDYSGKSELSRVLDRTLATLELPKPDNASDVSPPPDESAFSDVFMVFFRERLAERLAQTQTQAGETAI